MSMASYNQAADQAEALRLLMGGSRRRATTIAVTSGKGGVGKSNVAVNLAVSLALKGLEASLLDLDLGLANADVLMNVRGAWNISHVIAGTHRLQDVMQDGPGGARVLPGASGLERLANLSEFERHHLLRQFRVLESECDFLVMDLGAGVSKNVLAFAASADIVLIVTTPEPTALTDAYALVKMLVRQDRAADIEILVNLAESSKEARRTFERLAEVAGRFLGLPLTWAGYVLSDDAVRAAVRVQEPFVIRSPRCNASACIRALAQKYARLADVPVARESFFSRVAKMFY